jgi:hypothetical protein
MTAIDTTVVSHTTAPHGEIDRRGLPGHGLVFERFFLPADKARHLRPVIEAFQDRQHRHHAQEQHEPPRPRILIRLDALGRQRRRRQGVPRWIARGGIGHEFRRSQVTISGGIPRPGAVLARPNVKINRLLRQIKRP